MSRPGPALQRTPQPRAHANCPARSTTDRTPDPPHGAPEQEIRSPGSAPRLMGRPTSAPDPFGPGVPVAGQPCMSQRPRRPATRFLCDPNFWRDRIARLTQVQRGLILTPRPDLSSPFCEVVEWRLKAHDSLHLWGLRASSPFHTPPRGATIREVCSSQLPSTGIDRVADGLVDVVFQVPAGRRLEDRVLDLVRVYQMVLDSGIQTASISMVPADPEHVPDEYLIANGLVQVGLF